MADSLQPTAFPSERPTAGCDQRVPAQRAERERLRRAADAYAEAQRLVPPLAMEELRAHSSTLARKTRTAARMQDFLAVLIGNSVWRPIVAAVPFERRILMLPRCLRHPDKCEAQTDDLGLLCAQCGSCAVGKLQSMAERLGYVVLIAEGTTVVRLLLEQGRVDAVIGVSCMSALERSFPLMAAEAIPGLAIPLWRDGCSETAVDADWAAELIQLRGCGHWDGRMDLDALRDDVRAGFSTLHLEARMGPAEGATEQASRQWLLTGGKRWRPFLTVAVFRALRGRNIPLPETVWSLALAVECFHKASLVHDDIEDGDTERYGRPTLHQALGIPIALNIGDLLLGEGYRLIALASASAEQRIRMLLAAANGQRSLCRGQGDELHWVRSRDTLDVARVIDIFRNKTAPAFEVALRIGAIAGGADEATCNVLGHFSAHLGIAYQIRDDIEDIASDHGDDALPSRPSLLPAIDAAAMSDATRLERATDKARQLLDHHRNAALRALNPLEHAALKSLLRRVVRRILNDGEGPPHETPE